MTLSRAGLVALGLLSLAGSSGCASLQGRNAQASRPNNPPSATTTEGRSLFQGMLREAQWVMGTRLMVAVEPPAGTSGSELLSAAFAIARRLDRTLSNYRTDSALSQLNDGRLQRVPPELLEFLRLAQRWCQDTAGAFDISVGALTAARQRRRRGATALKQALGTVGCHTFSIRGSNQVTLRAGTRLDPGALGKGFAIDAMVASLRQAGVQKAFIAFGGSSFFGLGSPDGHAGWAIGLRGASEGSQLGVIALRDAALSSSRSLSEGRSHIVDPRTGELIMQPRSAAVIANSAADAEALSTALIVDGALFSRRAGTTSMLLQVGDDVPRRSGLFASEAEHRAGSEVNR